jgi:hypothetical protein
MWVEASQSFAESAVGDVHVFVGETFNEGSVFMTTEYPALLTNPNVTSILFHVVY